MGKKVIVTGGGGFLGRALVKRLLCEGYEVTSIARGDYPDLRSIGAKTISLDLGENQAALHEAFKDAFACFHVAAKVSMWGPFEEFFKANVLGTRNVLDACRAQGVRYLIFTSSPSVIADGTNLRGVDESIPYPKRYHAFYPQTKAQAEQEVLLANGQTLHTISLRPHLIFGPGDTSLEALVVKRAKQGRLVRVGSGKNEVDFSYIEDCVDAHLCALRALENNPSSRGKVYFISQGLPTNLWKWIDAALARNGFGPVKRSVPAGLAKGLGILMEFFAKISPIPFEPPFTRFLAEEMATDHYFNIAAARRDLGFEPKKKDIFTW